MFAHKARAQSGSETAQSKQVLTSLKDRASVMAHAMAADLEQVGGEDDIAKRLELFFHQVTAEAERLRQTHLDNRARILNVGGTGAAYGE